MSYRYVAECPGCESVQACPSHDERPTSPAPHDSGMHRFEALCTDERGELYARVLHLGEHMGMYDAVAESTRARWGHD